MGEKRLVWRIDSCWITSNVKLCLFSSPTLHTSFCLITVSYWCSNLSHVHTSVTHSTKDVLFSKAIRKIFMVRVHCCRITLHEDKPGHDSWELEAKFDGSLTNSFSIFPRSSHACETRGRKRTEKTPAERGSNLFFNFLLVFFLSIMRNNRIFVCQANRPLLLKSCDKNLKIIFVEKRLPHPFPAQKVYCPRTWKCQVNEFRSADNWRSGNVSVDKRVGGGVKDVWLCFVLFCFYP